MLPIRQRLSALTCLKAGPKAVLIEVCELAENGGKGCIATNDYLAKKLGMSLATVTRTVAALVGWGLLASRVVKAEANRRYLTPCAAVRACYACGSEAEQLAAAAELTIVKKAAEPELTIVKNEADYSQNSELTIVKTVTDYSQNASRVYGDDHYDQLKTTIDDQTKELASLRSALALAQAELEGEREQVAQLTAQLDELAAELVALKNNAQASRTRGARAAPLDVSTFRLPFWATPAFVTQLTEWLAYRQSKRDKLKPQSIQKLLDEMEGYDEEYCAQLFDYSIKNGYTGLTYQDTPHKFAKYLQAKQPGYGNAQHPSGNAYNGNRRPVAGAKPDFRAGQMAAALVGSITGGRADDLPY